MISKNKFVSIMNALKEADELQDKINELMQNARDNIRNDFMNAGGMMICHTDIVIELLGDMFLDADEYIPWWIYDTNYGKDHTEIFWTFDGENSQPKVIADIKTAEDLYDFLINEMKENETLLD